MKKNCYYLKVKITPNARMNKILEYKEDILRISIKKPPDNNQANKELIKFLAKELKIAPSNIEIISGQTSRQKKLAIYFDEKQIATFLENYQK